MNPPQNQRKLREALNVIGMPEGFTLGSREQVDQVHNVWKAQIVAARKSGNEDRERRLNSAWTLVKRRRDQWCDCGRRKYTNAARCPDCLMRTPVRAGQLAEVCEGTVSDDILIQSPRYSQLVEGLLKLDAVGKSTVFKRKWATIRAAASKCGLKVKIIGLKSHPGYCRVWRTDGLSIQEVNRKIIEAKGHQVRDHEKPSESQL